MTPTRVRGVVRGDTVQLDEHSSLPDGTAVVVTPAADESTRRGDAAVLLAALKAGPTVPVEWVDELQSLIEHGRRPPARPNLFADESGSP